MEWEASIKLTLSFANYNEWMIKQMNFDFSEYLAHSIGSSGSKDLVKEHLQKVADRAAEFASMFGVSNEAKITGLLHDLGKYGIFFQKRLEGKEKGIDHWSIGAWEALTRYKINGLAAALAIQGHHIGLQQASKDALQSLNPDKLRTNHPLELKLSEPGRSDLLIERFQNDGLVLPDQAAIGDSISQRLNIGRQGQEIADMLDIRMLFSALVDADFIETEAHFQADSSGNRRYRERGLLLNSDRDLTELISYLEKLSFSAKASPLIKQLRFDLLESCLTAASLETGLFTLTAPTGSGKTLSMLAFALKHAKEKNLKRIIVVIPYLSIIEQTVQVYRNVFEPILSYDCMERYILEDHSLAGTKNHEHDDIENGTQQHTRLLAENWDAPIVVTTSVQFLESLFANRPSACRKLHRLAQSIVLFDEVQTLPSQLVIPTLAALSRLSERYNSTVVLATATKPAFSHLDEYVRKYCIAGWQPREIVPKNLNLFGRVKRTQIKWPNMNHRISWEVLAKQIAANKQTLCIVNLKKHAADLFNELKKFNADGLFHLSTNMCPAHRIKVLEKVRERLKSSFDSPCCLVSTQCVEAGVDLDFPIVFRAFGPLEAIAQASGRCNRNNLLQFGEVHIFLPDEEKYPSGEYQRCAAVTRIILQQNQPAVIDIDDPAVYEKYYRELYDLGNVEELNKKLQEAIQRRDFKETAQEYQIIEKNAINVLVPYDLDIFNSLASEVRETGLTRKWIARARPYTVGLYKPWYNSPVQSYLDPVPVRKGMFSDDWFIYLNINHYDPDLGLIPPDSAEVLIA